MMNCVIYIDSVSPRKMSLFCGSSILGMRHCSKATSYKLVTVEVWREDGSFFDCLSCVSWDDTRMFILGCEMKG